MNERKQMVGVCLSHVNTNVAKKKYKCVELEPVFLQKATTNVNAVLVSV